jgi:hypothetical protein
VEVAKVKQSTGLTGVRNTKVAKKAASKSKGKRALVSAGKRKRRPTPKKRASLRLVAGKGRAVPPPQPKVRVTVKALDPLRKCGAATTVQLLFRVDETVDGRLTTHLVFFDRHGWYCEHGRNCPAVGHAKKHNGHVARVS